MMNQKELKIKIERWAQLVNSLTYTNVPQGVRDELNRILDEMKETLSQNLR